MQQFLEEAKAFFLNLFELLKGYVLKGAEAIGKDGWEDAKDHALIFLALNVLFSMGLSLIGSAAIFVFKNRNSGMSATKQAFSWGLGLLMAILLIALL